MIHDEQDMELLSYKHKRHIEKITRQRALYKIAKQQLDDALIDYYSWLHEGGKNE